MDGARLEEKRFPGRQGRIVFAYLAAQSGRAVPRDELAELLWGDELPATWEKALRVLMTKLRALLDECGIGGSTALTSAFGCYKLTLPAGAWIDVDAALEAVEGAEAELAAGFPDEARAQATVAAALARRSFLPGEEGAWVEERRRQLHEVLVRSLECLRDSSFAAGELSDAVRHAEEVIELEPFRETSYRRLMQVHAAAGNPAEALRVYERCRRFLAEELGAYPSPETESVYRELLRASTSDGRAALLEPGLSVVEPKPGPEGGGDAAFPPPEAPRAGRRWRRRIVLAALVVVGAVTAVTGYVTTRDESSLGTAQNPITIFTPIVEGEADHDAFVDVLRAFEETTGLHTETVHDGDARIVPDYRPALGFTGPGHLADFVADGTAEPLASLGLTEDVLEGALGRPWIELGTVDGEVYGLPVATGSKSLVWYRPRELRRLGLPPPRTWNELVALTERLARGGRKPWALGGSDSWTLTDWFENVYIRTQGEWKYDALFAGKLPFDDPSVIAALERMTTLLNGRYLAEGVDGALAMSFSDAVDSVFGADRRADLLMEAGFVGTYARALKPPPVLGTTIAAAPFPPIDSSFGNPVIAEAGVLVVFDDDPAVGRLLRYLISPGAGRIWVSTGTVVSSNELVPLSAYPNPLVRTAARQLTAAQVVRFDGSDLLPVALAEDLGRTLQAVIRRPAAAAQLMEEFQRRAAGVFNG